MFLHVYYLVLNEKCAYLEKHDLQKEASSCGNIVLNCACPFIKYGQLPTTQEKRKKFCLNYYKADFKLFITIKSIRLNNSAITIAISEYIYFSSLVFIQLAIIYPYINNFI